MSSSPVSYNISFGGQSGTIPGGAQNISLSIAAGSGGSGGFDSGGPGGGGGNGRSGNFTIPTSNSNRSFTGRWGARGSNGPGGTGAAVGGPGGNIAGGSGKGGKGGDDGTSGWSGCGAGGGAASVFYLGGNIVVTAGGGGGGGGGSYSCGGAQRPGGTGGTGGGFSSGGVGLSNGGGGGSPGGGDGGGGGGGGGGSSGGGGGGQGVDCNYGGGGGGGGTSRYNSSKVSFVNQSTNSGNGSMTLSFTVTIAEITSFTISPNTIIAGQSATLSWNTADSTSRSINQGIGSVGVSGSTTISPGSSRTYTMTAIGLAGNDTADASITVYPPTIATISASPNSIIVGQNSTLSWVVSGAGGTTASINQGIGAVVLTSNTSVSPSTSTTYTINASGLGGTDSDSVTISVYQLPEISYNVPTNIDYGDTLQFPVTYRYASGGVNGTITYTMRNSTTGANQTQVQNVFLSGTSSDESGAEKTGNVVANIPYGLHGVFAIDISLSSNGAGGVTNQVETINVNVDELPDNITIPNSLEQIPSDDVEAPDFDIVLSDPIVVSDIDVAVEIKSNKPIQVRFDDDDPLINSNWYDVRPN
jgi:hypothetical protein